MMVAYSLYDDFEYDVAALVYTIYPIDAGAAFVTPLLLLLLSLTYTLGNIFHNKLV